MGMTESGRQGDSVFLRGRNGYERCSLKLTVLHSSGLGHAAFRARSRQVLARRVAALDASGQAVGWHAGELGRGPAFQAHDPDGHLPEIYDETEGYEALEALRWALKNQAQRLPGRGLNVRRLDHFNRLAADTSANRESFQHILGLRLAEQIVLNDGTEVCADQPHGPRQGQRHGPRQGQRGPAARGRRRIAHPFTAAGNPFPSGRAALDPAVTLALVYASKHALLARPLMPGQVWVGLPETDDHETGAADGAAE